MVYKKRIAFLQKIWRRPHKIIFLNDNIVVNIGGDLDFNVRNTTSIQNGNFQWLPDLNIEFILTRDRKLRAIIFNRNSLDISGTSLGRRNRQGLSISYRKDFDKFIFW